MTTSDDSQENNGSAIEHIDMDDVLRDFVGADPRALHDNPAIQYLQSQYGFVTNLAHIKGAIDDVKQLTPHIAFIEDFVTA